MSTTLATVGNRIAKRKPATIHKLAFRGKVDLLEEALVSHPELVNSQDVNGATPLHHACFKGHIDCVKYLIQKMKANVNKEDYDNCTPAHTAAFSGKSECLRVLIENGAFVDHLDIDCSTPLHKACFNGNLECAQILVKSGANVNSKDREGLSVIHKTIYHDHVRVLEFLAERKADLQLPDLKGSTPLHTASFSGSLKCCQFLVRQQNITINCKDKEDTTPLHNAVFCGHTPIVEILVKSKCKLDEVTARYRSTALHFGAYNGYFDCVKILVENGANMNLQDSKGMSPFHYSIKREHEDCIEYFLEKRCDISLTDKKDRQWFKMTTNPKIIEKVNEFLKKTDNVSSIPSPSVVAKKEPDDISVYSKLDENGFIKEAESRIIIVTPPFNSDKEMSRSLKWNQIVKSWATAQKNQKRIKSLCEKGIPARVRGEVWKHLIRSTPEFLHLRKPDTYKNALNGTSEHEHQIEKDIKRTFPENILLMKEGGKKALFNVLKAHAVFNPVVGYCQGMGFICALFLMNMEEEDAFWALERLCINYSMESIWKPGLPAIPKCFYVLGKLMERYLPKVNSHLINVEVTPPAYATQWFITGYLYTLPFQICLRLWDIFLFEGFHFWYAVALALMKVYEDDILQMEFDTALTFLQFKQSKTIIDVDRVVKTANSYKEKVKREVKGLEEEYLRSLQPNSPRNPPSKSFGAKTGEKLKKIWSNSSANPQNHNSNNNNNK